MKLRQYERAQEMMAKIQQLYEARDNVIGRMDDTDGFVLHEKYFSAEFRRKMRTQIADHISGQIEQIESEFEKL